MSGTLPGAIEFEETVDVGDDDRDSGDEEIRRHGDDGLRIGKAKRAINPSCIAFSGGAGAESGKGRMGLAGEVRALVRRYPTAAFDGLQYVPSRSFVQSRS